MRQIIATKELNVTTLKDIAKELGMVNLVFGDRYFTTGDDMTAGFPDDQPEDLAEIYHAVNDDARAFDAAPIKIVEVGTLKYKVRTIAKGERVIAWVEVLTWKEENALTHRKQQLSLEITKARRELAAAKEENKPEVETRLKALQAERNSLK